MVKIYIIIVTKRVDNLDWVSVPGNVGSFNPSISAHGRYVAFQSIATNLVPDDTNGNIDPSFGTDIFVFDRDTDTIERVSRTDGGGQSNQASETPSISGDGRYLAFQSYVSTLVTPDSNGDSDIFMKDLTAGELAMLSMNSASIRGNMGSFFPSVPFDGRSIAFQSNADNLAASDINDATDIFVVGFEALGPSSIADIPQSDFSGDDSFGYGVNDEKGGVPPRQ